MTEQSSSGAAPLLAVRDLAVSYRGPGGLIPALREVSLDIWPGEKVAVVGESGSGKTTLAAAVGRLLAANAVLDTGTVTYDGRDLTQCSDAEMRAVRGSEIGFVPQNPMSNLNPLMRVGAQVAERGPPCK